MPLAPPEAEGCLAYLRERLTSEQAGLRLSGSTVSGSTACVNEGDGILATYGCTVVGNTVSAKTGFGLNLGFQSGYRENVISTYTGITVTGGVNARDNVCNGSLTCPRAGSGC